jgi:hypothetical protein
LRFILSLAAGLLLLAIGLAGAELVASWALPTTGVVPPDLFIADATRGLALRPGFHGTLTRAGHTFDVRIDDAGHRDDRSHEGATPHLLVVGSSAGFGVGLSRESSLVGQLAHDLAGRFDVINASVYTYGPVQALDTLQRECSSTQPALVFYLYEYKNTRDDFLLPRHFSAEAEIDAPNKPTVTLLSLRSLLSDNHLHPRQITERLIGLDRLSLDYRNRYVTTTGPGFSSANADRVGAIIGEMVAAARACGADFRVAILPGPNEAYYSIAEPATERVLAVLRAAGYGERVIDTRAGIPRGSDFFLTGIDYPSAAGSAYLGARIAAGIPAVTSKQSP